MQETEFADIILWIEQLLIVWEYVKKQMILEQYGLILCEDYFVH